MIKLFLVLKILISSDNKDLFEIEMIITSYKQVIELPEGELLL